MRPIIAKSLKLVLLLLIGGAVGLLMNPMLMEIIL